MKYLVLSVVLSIALQTSALGSVAHTAPQLPPEYQEAPESLAFNIDEPIVFAADIEAPTVNPTHETIHSVEYDGQLYNVVELLKVDHDKDEWDGAGNKIKKKKDHWWNIRGREFRVYKQYVDGKQATFYKYKLNKTAKKALRGVKDERPEGEKHPFFYKGADAAEGINKYLGPVATFILSLGGIL